MKHIGTVNLETPRLILRRNVLEDAQKMYNNWASDDIVTKYLTWPTHKSVEDSKFILIKWIEQYDQNDFYNWGIVVKETNDLIGNIAAVHFNEESESVEIGYCIGKKWWNQGYVTEAFKGVIEFLFNEVKVAKVTARHDLDNIASGKVIKKCGLTFTHQSIDKNNTNKECICLNYELRKEHYYMKDKLLFLAKNYDLVVGDKFELFYRGIIRSMNPYKYYIHVSSPKGRPYPRYYTFTPSDSEVGNYPLTVTLYDDFGNLIETASTNLHVVKPVPPKKKINVLCFGDSLTFNGVWPYEGFRRFTKKDGLPLGLGFENSLNFVGTMKKDEVGYEGYGGWQWRHFVTNEAVSTTSSVWVEVKEHKLDENDQHSTWKSNNLNWILESIEEKRLKFKRGPGNYSCLPKLGDFFENVEGGEHLESIKVENYYFEKGNPFYDENIKGPNFKKYCDDNGFEGLDYVYILLTWNGQYIPYNRDFSHFEPFITAIINRIHFDFPNAKVRLIGIQSPSIDGGIAANYGASGPYSDVFGEVSTAYNYNLYLEKLCEREEYKKYCKFIDMKAQFDVEYNMPSAMTPVNARSDILEKVGTNGVHPTMAGYLQIGDVFYRALVSDMEEEA